MPSRYIRAPMLISHVTTTWYQTSCWTEPSDTFHLEVVFLKTQFKAWFLVRRAIPWEAKVCPPTTYVIWVWCHRFFADLDPQCQGKAVTAVLQVTDASELKWYAEIKVFKRLTSINWFRYCYLFLNAACFLFYFDSERTFSLHICLGPFTIVLVDLLALYLHSLSFHMRIFH